MQQKSEPKSRIAGDLDSWKRIEGKMVERYGKRILYDRDFLKAKRAIYRHIRTKYKNSTRKLNFYEKAELKVLRGQQRSMLRQLYPNPFVRLIRNMLVFSGNLLMLPVKTVLSAVKAMPTAAPIQKVQQHRQGEDQQPHLKAIPPHKKTTGVSKTITKKMPLRSREQVSPRQSKGAHL